MTFIAIIFCVPLTQRTVLNIDLGADSCGLHIAESGSIKPEERNYIYKIFTNILYTGSYPSFVYIQELSVKLVIKDTCM